MDAADESVETALGSPAAADADRHVEFSFGVAIGPVQGVHQNFGLDGAAIDVNADVVGDLGAIVSRGQVIPPIGGKSFFGLHANGVAHPDAGEIHVHFTVIHVQTVAFAVGLVGHIRDDTAI